MKPYLLLTIAILSTSAVATYAEPASPPSAPLTRAEVKREVLEAQKDGELRGGDEPDYPKAEIAAAAKSAAGTRAADRRLNPTGSNASPPGSAARLDGTRAAGASSMSGPDDRKAP